MNKFIIIALFILSLFLYGCSSNDSKISKDNNSDKIIEQNIIKEDTKDDVCDKYKERISSELLDYYERASRFNSDYKKWVLDEVFFSNKLNHCVYTANQEYLLDGKTTRDYIISNAEKEELIEIFNESDKKSFENKVEELKK